MKADDPYGDLKIYHRAHLISPNGDVSPLCAEIPRAINLKRALWTNRDEAVTCRACLKKMADRHAPDVQD